MVKNYIKEELAQGLTDLDSPIESGIFDFIKKNKMICRIIYEDGSYKDFDKKFNKSYIITIKKRDYLVVPKCILRGKRPTIMWFFNNPMPINPEYIPSKLNALTFTEKKKKDLLSDEESEILAKTSLDAEGLHSIFNTKLIKGLYDQGGMSGKSIIIIMIVAVVVVLIILQLTGVVDVVGMLQGVK